MHTAQFIKLVTVAGWLWVSQGNLVRSEQVGLIAQTGTSSPCTVSGLNSDGLPTTIGTPPTGLRGTILISVTCPSGVGGTLQLRLDSKVVHNGGATMKFVSIAGALAGASTTASTGITDVVIPADTGIRTGAGSIQVNIVTNLSKTLLKSASDYELEVKADFINPTSIPAI
jgi:hypothetical protein